VKPIVFNASLFAGVLLIGIGVYVEFGVGYGLLASGAVVVGLTLYLARLAGVRAH